MRRGTEQEMVYVDNKQRSWSSERPNASHDGVLCSYCPNNRLLASNSLELDSI